MIEWKTEDAALGESAGLLAVEVKRLTRDTAEFFAASDPGSALDLLLDLAIRLQGSDFGNLQLYSKESRVLEIVRQRGFRESFLQTFRGVSADDPCSCGRALKSGNPIVVSDAELDEEFSTYWPMVREAGYRSVQSFPMINSRGERIGVISTHSRAPGIPSAVKMHLTTLFALQCADILSGFGLDAGPSTSKPLS